MVNWDLLQDYFIAGMIHTLKSMKELQQSKEESLDTVDFDFLIDRRMRDMTNPEVLETIETIEEEVENKYK